jgi:LPXTG-motif cell wall-anchored protein
MSPFIKTGLRAAGAGTAAAALTLAAAVPAFAQTDYEYLAVWFNSSETDEQFASLEYEGQEGYLAIEGPDAGRGDHIEYEVDFTAGPGAIEVVVPYDDRCEFADDRLVCVDDGSSGIAGTFMHFEMSLGEAGSPGDTIPYTVTAVVNGEDEVGIEGRIQVGEDYRTDDEPPVDELPADFPVGDLEGDGDAYGFAFLNHLLEGAEAGETLNAAPHLRVDKASDLGDDRAATALFFSDSVSLDAWFDEEHPTGSYTGTVEVLDEYDNCTDSEGGITCIVEAFDPQVGTTYAPSESTPIRYEVLGDVDDAEGAYYTAWDVNEATLDLFRQVLAVGPGAANQFELVATDHEIEDRYFSEHYGLIWFTDQEPGQGDVEPVDPDDIGGEASEQLPTTGNASIVLISSAAAALLAGAVVFHLMRRRKTAASW